MKQGLSLRVSQHLALTPQLQQSIRLLQLSTLELTQEIEQMLDENPFLEKDHEAAEREEYGLAQEDTPVQTDTLASELLSASAETLDAGEVNEAGVQEPKEVIEGQEDVFDTLNSPSLTESRLETSTSSENTSEAQAEN